MRHPFRKTLPSATFPKLERAQVKKVETPEKEHIAVQCCLIQGLERSESALSSLLSLAQHLIEMQVSIEVLLPEDLEDPESLAAFSDVQYKFYQTRASLYHMVRIARPLCIVLSSYDIRFGTLRRDPRTLRWAHEMPRYYDPQTSRCATPLFATAPGPFNTANGYAGCAPSYRRSWATLDAESCQYAPGPIRILATGNILQPRSNFKSFEMLAEKYKALQFIWHGAPREKTWGNIQFHTKQTSFTALLGSADLLLWCPDDEPCPLSVFQALYLGVRVMLFSKSVTYGLRPLTSQVDGSELLQTLTGSPLQAPLHAMSKNPKLPEDVGLARDYVLKTVGTAPSLLLEAIMLKLAPSQIYTSESEETRQSQSRAHGS